MAPHTAISTAMNEIGLYMVSNEVPLLSLSSANWLLTQQLPEGRAPRDSNRCTDCIGSYCATEPSNFCGVTVNVSTWTENGHG